MTAPKVLVTGGGRGIGRAIALRFAREGARVVVAARTSTELDNVVAEVERAGGAAIAAQMDVRDFGSVEAAVWRAVQFLGDSIDVLVNNAGVFDVQPIDKLDLAKWRWMQEVNVDGPLYVIKESLDALLESERAHVFNIASAAAKRGFPGNIAYCASKYALRGLSDALREDLRPKGVRVSTVYPGATDTTIFDRVPGAWDRTKMNRPEDVAEVIWRAWNAPASENVDDLDVPPRAP
ncbi:MAG: SDR family oxidoreductase [Planctomycetes bacterium]|nr:SDR family oxidoreductase [Planctomycetota bacterium]